MRYVCDVVCDARKYESLLFFYQGVSSEMGLYDVPVFEYLCIWEWELLKPISRCLVSCHC